MIHKLVNFFTSLRLTVVCLALAMLLVFIGTLAQVDEGLYAAQNRYFRSFLIYWTPKGATWGLPILPGGYLVGSVLIVNLIAAHIKRFTFTKKKLGIFLTHVGLIMLLIGGLLTDLFQVESHMRLTEGQAKNYSESGLQSELVFIDKSKPDADEVIAIPQSLLAQKGEIRHSRLPFTIRVKDYFVNSWPRPRAPMVETNAPQTTQGAGRQIYFDERESTAKMSDQNVPSAIIEILSEKVSEGTWAVSNWAVDESLLLFLQRKGKWSDSLLQKLSATQVVSSQGRSFEIALRPVRYYEPYSIELKQFTHDRYKGTEVPKNFASDIRLRHSLTGEDRSAHIRMNAPLRYAGKTYYQAGFDQVDPRVTILQVVRNPSRLVPYISCSVMALGLVVQFLMHLIPFAKKSAGKISGGKAQQVPPPRRTLPRTDKIAGGVAANGEAKHLEPTSTRRST
ncbi:MAG: cytochrome c biogenesis protein ResB [Verrucomicrobia bacterium]|nr:cytochrome c biogenesis protein ResB [Verrucomicrobiota bacterium]